MPPRRSLYLHLSALSDAEYAVYVEALRDIVDDGERPGISDEELENSKIGLPIVRAWMKGRFRDVGHPEIDKALQLFASQTSQKEMSGGHFLAALRLLMHVRRGGEINEAAVFVQAEPSSPTVSRHATFASRSGNISGLELPTTDSPVSAPKSATPRTNPFFLETTQTMNATTLAPPDYPGPDSPRRASLSSAPAVPPVSAKPRVDGVGVPPGSKNPFLQRAKTHSGTYESSGTARTPPLPPRKPSHMVSASMPSKPPPLPAKPIHSTQAHIYTSGNSSSDSSGSARSPPPVPHRVTPLMQQSLLASRVGASLKKAQEEASRTRILEIIRSSSDVSTSQSSKDRTRAQSSSRSPDKGARRPVPQPPRPAPLHTISSARSESGAPSVASLAEVASAKLAQSRMQPRTNSPDRVSHDSSSSDEEEGRTARSRQMSASEQFSPPPTHPARRPSAHSSGRGSRHIRTPSYQMHGAQQSPAGPSSINKSNSAPGIATQNHRSHSRSPSPSPSPSPNSPTQVRPSRSQSLHQSSSPTLASRLTEASSPLSNSQRRRPESAQFASRPRVLGLDNNVAADVDPTSPFSNAFGVQRQNQRSDDRSGGIVSGMTARFDKPSHRGSERGQTWDREKEKDQNAFTSLHRTFTVLQQKAEPAMTRARFKAEAGLLAPRRGFVPNSREYHMAGEDADHLVSRNSTGDDGGMDFTSVTTDADDDDTSADDTIRARGRPRSENAKQYLERDNLKLPEGEGWRRL